MLAEVLASLMEEMTSGSARMLSSWRESAVRVDASGWTAMTLLQLTSLNLSTVLMRRRLMMRLASSGSSAKDWEAIPRGTMISKRDFASLKSGFSKASCLGVGRPLMGGTWKSEKQGGSRKSLSRWSSSSGERELWEISKAWSSSSLTLRFEIISSV